MLRQIVTKAKANLIQDVHRVMASNSSRAFANLDKNKEFLHDNWLAVAEKETKGKINIREKLIRVTNEQMLMKPIYTSKDWAPPAEKPEISGKFAIIYYFIYLL